MLYFINPSGPAREQGRTTTRRSTMARKRKHRRGRKRRRNPGLTPAVAAFANPRRRRRRGNPFRAHRRRRRSNPFGGLTRGLGAQLMQGATDAVGIVAGKAASRALPQLVGLSQTGIVGVAIQAGAAVAAGFLGGKVNRNFGRMVLAGGLAGILEGYIKVANIPVISASLGDEYDAVMGLYVQPTPVDGGGGGGSLGLYRGEDDGYGGGGEDVSESVGFLPG
jgi:hypothetical protein